MNDYTTTITLRLQELCNEYRDGVRGGSVSIRIHGQKFHQVGGSDGKTCNRDRRTRISRGQCCV